MIEHSLWAYFNAAGPVVKVVMLLLFFLSVFSWTLIIQRGFLLRQAKMASNEFEELFWSGIKLDQLYSDQLSDEREPAGLAAIFQAGFSEFTRLYKQNVSSFPNLLRAIQRGMSISQNQERNKLERNLSFLASIGSISPYIGLLGTVWGIMTSFQGLAGSNQAVTIALVAPGISEALVATALGLFASIPAVFFYNVYVNAIDHLLSKYDIFQEEFMAFLERQNYGRSPGSSAEDKRASNAEG